MKNKKAWLGLLISIVFLYLAFRHSDWRQIWNAASRANFLYFLAALPVMALAFWLKAVRWRYLLLPSGRPGLHSLFGGVMIGYMALNLLPLRLGEFIRAYVLGRREKISASAVFATVVVERIFDGFTLLAMLLLPLFFLPLPLGPETMAWVRTFAYLGLAIYALAALFVVLVKVKTDLIILLIEKTLGWFPPAKDLARRLTLSFASGLASVSDWRLFLIITLYSILIWLAYTAVYWLTMYAFRMPGESSIGGQLGYLGSIFVNVTIALGIMIPSSPGFVGVFELACIMSLTALGVNRSLAESYALTVHAYQFIPITLTGIIYLYAQNFTFREIQTAGQETRTELKPSG
ncbi:MAG: lysylphosphatidylglycerol synthase transmembrane domain-containing protein [Thermodesulfobacteriota bacterium]